MPLGHIMRLDLEKIALEYIVPCLHEIGFCYLDNFLGEVVGDCVLERVKQLHHNGALRDGQLAGPRAGVSKRHLRGDQITWIGGNEEGCEAISFLLSLIDRLVLYCGSRLGKYYVKERSKVGRAREREASRVGCMLGCSELWFLTSKSAWFSSLPYNPSISCPSSSQQSPC